MTLAAKSPAAENNFPGRVAARLTITVIVSVLLNVSVSLRTTFERTFEFVVGTIIPQTDRYSAEFSLQVVTWQLPGIERTELVVIPSTAGKTTSVKITFVVRIERLIRKRNIPPTVGTRIASLIYLQIIDGTFVKTLMTGSQNPLLNPGVTLTTKTVEFIVNGAVTRSVRLYAYREFMTKTNVLIALLFRVPLLGP